MPVPTPSVLNLPDELIYEILGYLNQIHILPVRLLNLNFYIMATKRLFNSIYVNNGDPVVISSDVVTPFYLKYTVLNQLHKFIQLLTMKELPLVSSIVIFTNYGISPELQNLINSMPQIYIENEYKGMIHHNCYISKWFKFTITEFNYTTEQLTITGNETKLLPLFKRLRSVRVVNGTSNMFNNLNQDTLSIRDLSLEFRDPPNRLDSIKDIFNLGEIQSLELKFNLVYPPPSVQDLTDIATKLSSIRHFAIISPNIRFDKIIHQLKPNSLTSFYLKILGNYYVSSSLRIFEILKYQNKSIGKFYWSCIKSNSRFKEYGLQEFERVYKNVKNKDKLDSEFLLHSGKFENLHQVVLNEHYFMLNRFKYIDIVCFS